MKKSFFVSMLTTLALTANAQSLYDTNYIEKWGKLKLEKNQLSDKDGNPIQLRGWSTFGLHFSDVEGCLGKEQWQLMKSYGANVVRLAMFIDNEDDGGSYLAKPEEFTKRVKAYIEDAYNVGIYVVVDWHLQEYDLSAKKDMHSGDPNDYVKEAQAFFSEISKYCAEKEYDNVLYEICNEPRCDSWASIKSYAEQVIPKILVNQRDALIIVGTNNWCQQIMSPVADPLTQFRMNVLYSFHYSACTHYSLLGDFRGAQQSIPVFVSEWSAVQFNGEGPFCKKNSDDFIYACKKENTDQLVSWCVWNWGKKDDASSFFVGACDGASISQKLAVGSDATYGDYIVDLVSDLPHVIPCCVSEERPHEDPNKIPTTAAKAWHWDAYNYGGEGIAYHDENSSAWIKDESGIIVDYRTDGEEVDVLSLANTMQWIDKKFPYAKVEDNVVIEFDSTISTLYKDEENKPTYKSLNGGRYYSGNTGSRQPDDGVDLNSATLAGTEYAYSGYQSLDLIEDGEWINYTVDVAKAGYYKISGVISSEYRMMSPDGNISIVSELGNNLRTSKYIVDPDKVKTFGFPQTTACSDATKSITEPWDCWAISDAISGKYDEILVAFPKAGLNEIKFIFSENTTGIGPLLFEFYAEYPGNDPLCCEDVDPDGEHNEDGNGDGVSNVNNNVQFSITPNPTSGEFTVALAENVEATVEIVNMAGQVAASKQIVGTAKIEDKLPAGVYSVVVKTSGAVNTQKLIVK